MKKFLAILLAVVMLLPMFAVSTSADELYTLGTVPLTPGNMWWGHENAKLVEGEITTLEFNKAGSVGFGVPAEFANAIQCVVEFGQALTFDTMIKVSYADNAVDELYLYPGDTTATLEIDDTFVAFREFRVQAMEAGNVYIKSVTFVSDEPAPEKPEEPEEPEDEPADEPADEPTDEPSEDDVPEEPIDPTAPVEVPLLEPAWEPNRASIEVVEDGTIVTFNEAWASIGFDIPAIAQGATYLLIEFESIPVNCQLKVMDNGMSPASFYELIEMDTTEQIFELNPNDLPYEFILQAYTPGVVKIKKVTMFKTPIPVEEPDEPVVTDAPVTDAPVTDAPETDAPVTDAPETDAPETDAPEVDEPKVEDPKPAEQGAPVGIIVAVVAAVVVIAAVVVFLVLKKKK